MKSAKPTEWKHRDECDEVEAHAVEIARHALQQEVLRLRLVWNGGRHS
jgi:hypothetical protein